MLRAQKNLHESLMNHSGCFRHEREKKSREKMSFKIDRLTIYKSQSRWLIVGKDLSNRHRMLQVSRERDKPSFSDMGRYFDSSEVLVK